MDFKKRHSGRELNIFTEIGEYAEIHNAINLSQGTPDYPLDKTLANFLIEAVGHDMNSYASQFALPVLKENLIKFNLKRSNPLTVCEKELSIVPGATYAMYVAFATFIEAEDEVIILEPCYETYIPAVEIRKAKPVFVCMTDDNEINWQKIKDSVTKKTKAIIVNSPHNPTGIIWSQKDWDTLWEIIKDTSIIVISDEVYDMVCYEQKFYSASHHPAIKNRCFCIYSFEKMFHISGWKASYVIASSKFTKAFQRIHQYLTFTVNSHAQYALAKYLEVFDAELNRSFFQNKRNLFCSLLKELPIHIHEPAKAGYFQTVGFKQFEPRASDKDFTKLLIEKAKVAAIPYSAFYSEQRDTGNLRFCFAKKDETLIQSAENLKYFFENY